MSLPYKTDVTGDAREASIEQTRSYVRSERPVVIYSEQFKDLKFTELSDSVSAQDAKLAAGKETSHPYVERIRFILALAASRDAGYAHANRTFLMAHGAQNKIVEDFSAFATTAVAAGGPVT